MINTYMNTVNGYILPLYRFLIIAWREFINEFVNFGRCDISSVDSHAMCWNNQCFLATVCLCQFVRCVCLSKSKCLFDFACLSSKSSPQRLIWRLHRGWFVRRLVKNVRSNKTIGTEPTCHWPVGTVWVFFIVFKVYSLLSLFVVLLLLLECFSATELNSE